MRDRFVLTTKDDELCPLPSVSKFNIENVTTTSVLIAWESKENNMTGLKRFLVAYHRMDKNDVVRKFQVNPTSRKVRLNNLMDDSVYLVCVITQGSSYADYQYSESSPVFASLSVKLQEETNHYLLSDQQVTNTNEEHREIQTIDL